MSEPALSELTEQLRAAEISLDTFLQEAKRAGVDRVEAARLARGTRAWPDPDAGAAPRAGGTLRVGLWLPAEGLDAAISTYRTSRLVTEQLYSTLTALDANGRPYPDLATWIDVSDDARTYTFGIRGGVRFHDGSPVTADDVAFTFNRLLELGEAYHFDPWVATLAGRRGRRRRRRARGPDPPQPDHRPDPDLARVRRVRIVPRAAVEAGRDLVTDPIGSGPFRYDADGSSENVARVVRHPGGDHAAALDAVEFVGIRDDAERAEALLEGRIDLDALMAPAAWDAVDGVTGTTARSRPSDGRYHWLMINCADALLADPGVRRAIAVGLDRVALAEQGFGPHAHPITGGPVPPWSWAADPDLEAFRPTGDQALARALLDAAGAPEGTPIKVTAPEALPLARRQGELIVDQLRAIGLDAQLDLVSPAGLGRDTSGAAARTSSRPRTGAARSTTRTTRSTWASAPARATTSGRAARPGSTTSSSAAGRRSTRPSGARSTATSRSRWSRTCRSSRRSSPTSCAARPRGCAASCRCATHSSARCARCGWPRTEPVAGRSRLRAARPPSSG